MSGCMGDDFPDPAPGDVHVVGVNGRVELRMGLQNDEGDAVVAFCAMLPEGAYEVAQNLIVAARAAVLQTERINAEANIEAARIIRAMAPLMRVPAKQ